MRRAQAGAGRHILGPQLMEWQPIETAPKDGTTVDIFVVLEGGYRGRFTDYYWQSKRKIWRYTHGGDIHPDQVTHWMPLPDGPN